jgi:metallo-beta-lactamase family protein
VREAPVGTPTPDDADEIIAWLAGDPADPPPRPDVCYVVHGQPSAAKALAERLRSELGWLAVLPDDGEVFRLD